MHRTPPRAALSPYTTLFRSNAVAAADFCVVREGGNGGIRVRESAPSEGEGLAEDQPVADFRDVLLPFQQVEIPVSVRRIAVEHQIGRASCRVRGWILGASVA